MRSLKGLDLKGKTVLLRTNFDVPVKAGKILDDSRIKESIPTIKYLLKKKSKVLIVTHLGRPEKKDKKFSLEPVARKLKKLLGVPVIFLPDILRKNVKEKIKKSSVKSVILFENIRFYDEEKTNNFQFTKKISELADLYVNDAFPVCHRSHASVDAITRYLPSYAGISLEKEVLELSKIKDTPTHPFVVVIGGAKVSDKIGIILSLAKKADYILIGGAAANIMLKASGYKLGSSLIEEKALSFASKILDLDLDNIILPIDAICAESLDATKMEIIDIPSIPKELCSSPFSIYDIGPKTIIKWQDIIKTAKTVFWSGPLGVFEYPLFAKGTKTIARAISKNLGETVVGGGDTVSAISNFRIKRFSHISTAGSAMLQYIAGEELPGLRALDRKI